VNLALHDGEPERATPLVIADRAPLRRSLLDRPPANLLQLATALGRHAVACAAAREHGGIVAPPDYWHIHELGGYAVWAAASVGEVRPWLTAVPPWQHFKNVAYHVRAADALGFHAAIFLTGHYGPNWKDLKTLLNLLQPHVATRLYGLPDFECNQPGFDGDGKATGDHAGKVETSLLWAVEPDCVDFSRLPEPGATSPTGHHFAMGANAREANRQVGERMVADEVRWLGEKARELLAAYQAPKADRRPLTFGDVERIWEEEVRPRLPEFETMKPRWGDQEPQEGSRWRANWKVPKRS